MKKTMIGTIAVCLQLACFSQPSTGQTPPHNVEKSSNNSNLELCNKNKLVIEDFYLAYQNNDTSFFSKIMDKNYGISNAAEIHEMSYSKYSEMSKNIKVRVQAMHKALPNFSLEVKELFSDGNKVFSKVTISGIQKGEFLGTVPTNKPIHINVYAVFTVEDNKIQHISEMWNELSVMRQLGCVML
jgi:predicted ester cyclase